MPKHNTTPPLAAVREALPHAPGVLRELMEQSLLAAYAPPATIVTEKGDVLYFSGQTGRYLEPGSGEASLNLLVIAREGLRSELTLALQGAAAHSTVVRREGLPFQTGGAESAVTITIRPLLAGPRSQGLFLVTFEEPLTRVAVEPPLPAATPEDAALRLPELEHELRLTREHLQSTIEELAAANGDLRSSNEELQSSNEELQSTNEELETSKEELQSVNEELTTVNTELEMNLDQLSKANSDLNNLLANTEIGTIFLNHELRIQRYTSPALRFVNLIPHDVGRPLAHVVTNLFYNDLVLDARLVLETLAPRLNEVRTVDDRWCSVRLMPYRTVDNTVDGVVITFTDTTEQRHSQDRALMMRWAVERAPSLVVITDADGRVEYVNPSFTALTGFRLPEMLGQTPRFLEPGEHPAEFFGELWATLRAEREWHGEICTRLRSGDPVWLRTTITPVKNPEGAILHYLMVQEDRTEARSIALLRRMAAVMQDADEAITIQDFDGRILSWNRGAEALYGWSEAEALQMTLADYTSPERPDEPTDIARRLLSGGAVTSFRTERLSKSGARIAVWLTVKRLLDDTGQPVAITTSERPVTPPAAGDTVS